MYYFRVEKGGGVNSSNGEEGPSLVQKGKPLNIRGGCCSIFDMKVNRMEEYNNSLIVLASGQEYQNLKN